MYNSRFIWREPVLTYAISVKHWWLLWTWWTTHLYLEVNPLQNALVTGDCSKTTRLVMLLYAICQSAQIANCAEQFRNWFCTVQGLGPLIRFADPQIFDGMKAAKPFDIVVIKDLIIKAKAKNLTAKAKALDCRSQSHGICPLGSSRPRTCPWGHISAFWPISLPSAYISISSTH